MIRYYDIQYLITWLYVILKFLADDAPTVTTSLGVVQGSWAQSIDGRTYAAFEGIPYAEKPVGQLRFEVCNFSWCYILTNIDFNQR